MSGNTSILCATKVSRFRESVFSIALSLTYTWLFSHTHDARALASRRRSTPNLQVPRSRSLFCYSVECLLRPVACENENLPTGLTFFCTLYSYVRTGILCWLVSVSLRVCEIARTVPQWRWDSSSLHRRQQPFKLMGRLEQYNVQYKCTYVQCNI